ncbi:MAG: hypothetical protein Q7J98_11715 [Kiritimatiellia bacterium]|nr:hypothetical protein [Kiritimatiellia bacterium]
METYHRFAWQGYSCDIPADWNLAEYKVVAGVSYARFHDDFNRRLDFEWVNARRRIKIEEVRGRYNKIADSMKAAGAQSENIEDMPGGWLACLYSMPDGKRLMAAFRLVPENNFFCLLKIYFENAGRREADRIVHRIAGTFRLYEHGLVPWAVYDIDFQLWNEFKLIATSFQAGRKLMIFEWRLRRLYLNFISLADILCKDHSMEKWCADQLHGFKGISGVKFTAGCEGEIIATHNWWRFWGNIEPVTRGCLHYKVWCRRIPEKNQIFLGVFNYRGHADLSFLENSLGGIEVTH